MNKCSFRVSPDIIIVPDTSSDHSPWVDHGLPCFPSRVYLAMSVNTGHCWPNRTNKWDIHRYPSERRTHVALIQPWINSLADSMNQVHWDFPHGPAVPRQSTPIYEPKNLWDGFRLDETNPGFGASCHCTACHSNPYLSFRICCGAWVGK